MTEPTTERDTEPSESEIKHVTSEPTRIEWEGGVGDDITVDVNPYTGTVTVNDIEHDVGDLEHDDYGPGI